MFINRIRNGFKAAVAIVKLPYQKLKETLRLTGETLHIVKPIISLQKIKYTFIAGSIASLTLFEFGLYYLSLQRAKEGSETALNDNMMLILGNLFGGSIIRNLRDVITRNAEYELSKLLKITVLEKTLTNRGNSIGIQFLQDLEKMKDPKKNSLSLHEIIINCNDFGSNTVKFTFSIVSESVTILLNLYFLKNLFELINDKRILAASSILGISFAGFMGWISDRFEKICITENENASKIQSQFQFLEAHPFEISALKGELKECSKLVMSYQQLGENKKNTNLTLFGFQSSNDIFYNLLGAMLEAYTPVLLATQQTNFFTIAMMHRNLLNVMFALKSLVSSLTQNVSAIAASHAKYREFIDLTSTWEQFQKNRKFMTAYDQKVFSLNLNVHIPKKHFNLKSFNEVMNTANLLRNAELRLKPGAIYKLLGNSGIGKTTLLKAILGHFPCTTGKIGFPCKAHEIFYQTQSIILPDESTLLEAITYPEAPNLNSRQLKNLHEMMSALGLKNKIDDLMTVKNWPRILSGGEQKKVSLLRVLVKAENIKFLILDEPSAGLDTASRQALFTLIKQYLSHALVIYTDHVHDENLEVKELAELIKASDSGLKSDTIHPERKTKKEKTQEKELNREIVKLKEVDQKIETLYSYLRLRTELRPEFYQGTIEIDVSRRRLISKTHHS